MNSLFSLHPVAVAGELLGGRPSAGPAKQDAEPERDEVRAARRRLPRPVVAFRRRRDAAAAARSANAYPDTSGSDPGVSETGSARGRAQFGAFREPRR